MDLLVISLKKTVSIAEGYIVGILIMDNYVYLEQDNGTVINLNNTYQIEVLNGWNWQIINYKDLRVDKTFDGTPLYAGLECRVKQIGVDNNAEEKINSSGTENRR